MPRRVSTPRRRKYAASRKLSQCVKQSKSNCDNNVNCMWTKGTQRKYCRKKGKNQRVNELAVVSHISPMHSSRQSSPHSSRQSSPHSSRQSSPHSSRQSSPHSSRQSSPHSSRQSSPHSSRQSSPHSSRQSSPHSSRQSSRHSRKQKPYVYGAWNKHPPKRPKRQGFFSRLTKKIYTFFR